METLPNYPVLIRNDDLLSRIDELAREIGAAYRDEPAVFVAVLEGARTFAAHLLQRLPGAPPCHEVKASSYGDATTSSGNVAVTGQPPPVANKRVVLIEDIVDTGRTIERLVAWLRELGATEVKVATLLSKPSRRVVRVDLEWVGFEIPDEFVVGFGMDVAGKMRELPDVQVFVPERP